MHIPTAAACFENVIGYFAKSVSLRERTRSGSDAKHRDGGTCRRYGAVTVHAGGAPGIGREVTVEDEYGSSGESEEPSGDSDANFHKQRR